MANSAMDGHHQWLSDVFDAVNELYPLELAKGILKVAKARDEEE